MPTLSARIPELHASPIREILAVINRPGMISFAGGLPSPDSFPPLNFGDVPPYLLQYGASEGEPQLREQISTEMSRLGLRCDATQVLILSGSQQGIDLVAKLLVDRDTPVALENPGYLAALQVFRFFGARFASLDRSNPSAVMTQAEKPRLCYVIPTFQNPTGYCYTSGERQQLASSCDRHDVVLFEDDPYRDLVFDACERQPICSLVRKAAWVYQGSFSKSIAPGLRLGFLVASPELMPYLIRLKQAADLHSNRLSQFLILQALTSAERPARMQQLQQHYRDKRDSFDAALRRHLGDLASWNTPQGGLFFWLKLRQRLDTTALLQRALAQGVAFMPGEPFFYTPQQEHSYIRLNFSHASAQQQERGIAILRNLLQQADGISPVAEELQIAPVN